MPCITRYSNSNLYSTTLHIYVTLWKDSKFTKYFNKMHHLSFQVQRIQRIEEIAFGGRKGHRPLRMAVGEVFVFGNELERRVVWLRSGLMVRARWDWSSHVLPLTSSLRKTKFYLLRPLLAYLYSRDANDLSPNITGSAKHTKSIGTELDRSPK